MPAAFGTIVNVVPGTGVNTGASPSITTPATNPVVIVKVGLKDAGLTVVVSSLTITGFGGTASEVVFVRNAVGGEAVSIWKIVAPTPNTAGTVQANLSSSEPFQMTVETWSGAHQTDPSPTGDAVTSVDATNPHTLTPTNLTADDASSGAEGNGGAMDLSAVSPTSDYLDNTTAINFGAGHATGTTGVTFAGTGSNVYVKAAVRIVAAAAAGLTAAQELPAFIQAGGAPTAAMVMLAQILDLPLTAIAAVFPGAVARQLTGIAQAKGAPLPLTGPAPYLLEPASPIAAVFRPPPAFSASLYVGATNQQKHAPIVVEPEPKGFSSG